MKNNRKQKELPTLGKFNKVLERQMMTQNNYRKYHHIPMLRGEIKHQKRLLTITFKKYIGKTVFKGQGCSRATDVRARLK